MAIFAAFSGGKDSTAMVLRLAEQGDDFSCLFTPTGNDFDDLMAHIQAIIARINRPLVILSNRDLRFWIEEFQALPNWRMRWCTRLLKIVPCLAFLQKHPSSTLCVGLRADEDVREGIYGDVASYRYPLREWGWAENEVWRYLEAQQVSIPLRTNCQWCYYQRLSDWYELYRSNPASYAAAEALEQAVGHTFRSGQRDTWPASLVELRACFEQGRKPRGVQDQQELFRGQPLCRACTL